VEIKDGYIGPDDLKCIYKIMRLRRSLGVNLMGASIIVEIMERIEELEEENKKIRKKR